MTIADTILIIAPEFTGVDATGAISIADMEIAPSLGGTKRDLLVAYLAAHILTIARRKLGASGEVTSIKEGSLAATYSASTAKINSGLSKTSYGQEYDRLCRGYIFTPRTRMTGRVNASC